MASLFLSSFILGIIFCAPPGIITAETIRRGLARGFQPALFVQFGSLIGDSTWAILALTGLAFITQYPLARTILMGIGVILLAKLALDAFRASQKTSLDVNLKPVSARGDFVTGAALSLSNPLNIVFWTGIGTTAFTSLAGQPQPIHLVTFFMAFMTGALVWCFFLAGLVAWGKRFITPIFFRWVNLVCGLALVYFGVQLGWQMISGFVN